jgi:hypothetical protein
MITDAIPSVWMERICVIIEWVVIGIENPLASEDEFWNMTKIQLLNFGT